MEIKIDSAEELVKFLRLYGFDDFGGVEKIYENMPKPIRVGESSEERILQIAKVWEKANARYVLWNDSSVEIHIPEYPTYKYMDVGRYKYDGVFLLFDRIDGKLIRTLKRCWKDLKVRYNSYDMDLDEGEFSFQSYHPYVRERFAVTPKEFYYFVDLRDKKIGSYPPVYVEKWIEAMTKSIEKTQEDIRFTRDSINIGNKRYGIEGVNLNQYLRPFVYEVFYERVREPQILEEIMYAFYEGLESFFTPGEYTLLLGRVSVPFRVRKSSGSVYRFLGDARIRKDEFKEVLQKTKSLGEEGFLELLKKLKGDSLYSVYIKENGIVLLSEDSSYPELAIVVKAEREKGKWYAICPMDERRFVVPQGIQGIRKLQGQLIDVDFSVEDRPLFEVYKLLSEFIPEAHVLHIIENARREAKESLEKSVKLLKDTLEKYKDRLVEHKVEFGHRGSRDGYLVKGKRRNYFVVKSSLDVYTYPGLEHICIVDKDYKSGLPQNDRLVNRLLLLLNDEDLEGQISTMQEGDYYEEDDEMYLEVV